MATPHCVQLKRLVDARKWNVVADVGDVAVDAVVQSFSLINRKGWSCRGKEKPEMMETNEVE